MYNILLIYDNCSYYSNPTRIVVLIREICNAIIDKAVQFCSGSAIIGFLDEEPHVAVENLKIIIN